MSVDAIGCASHMMAALWNYGEKKKFGRSYGEMLIRMPSPIDRDRRPDVIFVSYARWSKGKKLPTDRSWEVTPDLCVEVVSPTDHADDVREKIDEYFDAGIPMVWVVYPQRELVDVYESPAVCRTVRRNESLEGGTVLPGFRLALSELFPE